MTEKTLTKVTAQYLKRTKLIYRFDVGADLKLSIGQARANKAIQGARGYPDLFIAEPKDGFHGFYIELKVVSPYKKDGTLKKNVHLEAQDRMLRRLRTKGYWADFATGWVEVKEILNRISVRQA